VFFITPSEEDLEKTLFYQKPQQEEEEESDTESVKTIKLQKKSQQKDQTDTASIETIKPRNMKTLHRVLAMSKLRPSIDTTIHPPASNGTIQKITKKLSNYF